MNTGIGDAVNLAWKLAAVVQGRAKASLLDTYEPERQAFAQVLIKSTDRAFKLITGRSWLSRVWRQHVMPRVAGTIANSRRGGRDAFRLLSQTRINYRGTDLSAGQVGQVRGGVRALRHRARHQAARGGPDVGLGFIDDGVGHE